MCKLTTTKMLLDVHCLRFSFVLASTLRRPYRTMDGHPGRRRSQVAQILIRILWLIICLCCFDVFEWWLPLLRSHFFSYSGLWNSPRPRSPSLWELGPTRWNKILLYITVSYLCDIIGSWGTTSTNWLETSTMWRYGTRCIRSLSW